MTFHFEVTLSVPRMNIAVMTPQVHLPTLLILKLLLLFLNLYSQKKKIINPSFEFCQYSVICRPQKYWMTCTGGKTLLIPHDSLKTEPADVWLAMTGYVKQIFLILFTQIIMKEIQRAFRIKLIFTDLLFLLNVEDTYCTTVPVHVWVISFNTVLKPPWLILKHVWFLCSHTDKSTGWIICMSSSSNSCHHNAGEWLTTRRWWWRWRCLGHITMRHSLSASMSHCVSYPNRSQALCLPLWDRI